MEYEKKNKTWEISNIEFLKILIKTKSLNFFSMNFVQLKIKPYKLHAWVKKYTRSRNGSQIKHNFFMTFYCLKIIDFYDELL